MSSCGPKPWFSARQRRRCRGRSRALQCTVDHTHSTAQRALPRARTPLRTTLAAVEECGGLHGQPCDIQLRCTSAFNHYRNQGSTQCPRTLRIALDHSAQGSLGALRPLRQLSTGGSSQPKREQTSYAFIHLHQLEEGASGSGSSPLASGAAAAAAAAARKARNALLAASLPLSTNKTSSSDAAPRQGLARRQPAP